MKKISAASFFCLVLNLGVASQAPAGELHGIIKNNEGVSRYDKGKPNDAYGFFTDALGDSPFAPEIQFNIGDAFLQMKDVDKAISQYRLAIKLAPGTSKREQEIRFRSFFNIGAVSSSQSKTDEALEAYQQALEIKPDSLEVKTNMELLTQQGGQGGKGDKEQKDKKDGDGGDSKEPPKMGNKQQDPQPYKGKDLSKQDVDRILEELKQQEESIRAKDQHEGGKDAPPDKDW
jgi:tetratricopeptide (TPR) repeat protein